MTVEQVKELIIEWVRKWYPIVADPRLEVEVTWAPGPDIKSGCLVTERYLACEIEFSPTRIIAVYTNGLDGEVDLEGIEREVIHECAHTIPWHAAQRLVKAGVDMEEAEDIEDQMAVMIDRAVWKAYQLGREENGG